VTKAPKNIVASVLARLRNVAQEAGLSFNDILQSYVIDRFLSRLSRSPHADTLSLFMSANGPRLYVGLASPLW
jgi:hypothetical protein